MSEPRKILVVEDDAEQRRIVRLALLAEGHRVVEAESAELGRSLFRREQPDLVVLDLKLGDGSGIDVCREIRAHKTRSDTPVVILTGEGELEDKSEGFDAGADQYLVKPVSPKELLLWVRALFRRRTLDKDEEGAIEIDELAIDPQAQIVRFRGEAISDLTVKEFELLLCLVRRRPRIVSREYVLSKVWKTVAVDNLVAVHLSNLRKKLPTELADRIQNVSGRGYRFF